MNEEIFSNIEFQKLSPEKQNVIKSLEEGNNIFITGGAGTGKSYLLNFIKRHYVNHGLHLTASTGIAAVNISGSTIHSWSGIGLGNLPISQIIRNLLKPKSNKIRRKIQQANILAIDEISMISAEILEILDQVFKEIRLDDRPMGGLQMLFFGDFLQLPPISKFNEKADFCFKSKVWNDLNLEIFELTEIYRQKDKKFSDILNNIRFGKVGENEIEILSKRINASDNSPAIKPTILTTHNAKAEEINQAELRKIVDKQQNYQADYFGDKKKIELLQKNSIASPNLNLKIGAQVMMTKNTYQKDGIINGSLGIVRDFSPKKSFPIVEFSNGKTIKIKPEEWLIERFDEDKKELITEAGVIQLPLILSWAITIHKSQGLTLDKISCDLSSIFSPGQAYVALSRARNLEGVFIKSINFNKIKSDEEATRFYKNYL